MALNRQNIALPFAAGLDLKTDPYQVRPPKVEVLQNAIFTEGMSIHKRYGYNAFSTAIAGTISSITNSLGGATFQNELLEFDGTSIYSYNQTGLSWTLKGPAISAALSVIPVVRNTVQQTSQDSAYHQSGYYCYVWENGDGTSQYSIIDSNTDQIIVSSVSLGSVAKSPKVNAVGLYFLISYVDTSLNRLRRIAIPVATPMSPQAPVDITTTLNAGNPVYDAAVLNPKNGNVFFAWNNASGSVSTCYINAFLSESSTLVVPGHSASIAINIFSDPMAQYVWIAAYDGTTIAYTVQNISLQGTPPLGSWTTLETLSNVRNITGTVIGTTGTIFYEVSNTISYNTIVRMNTGTSTGTVGTPSVFLRSVGLWAKCFQYNGIIYLGVTYSSQLQPVYFIVNSLGRVITKIAYQNAGGLTAKSLLPQVNSVSATKFEVAYLVKDLLEAQSGNIYTQTGVNQASIDFSSNSNFSSVTLGSNLHISGGILSMYDGVSVIEHGFFLYPETPTNTVTSSGGGIGWGSLVEQPQWQYSATYEWTDQQGNIHRSAPSVPLTVNFAQGTPVVFTATSTPGSKVLTAVSSTAGLFIGQVLSGLDLQPLTSITAISGSTVTLSLPAISTPNTVTVLTQTPSITFTATITSGSNSLTNIANTSDLYVGMMLYGPGIQPGATIATLSTNSLTMSSNALSSISTTDTNSNSVVIDTLRITQKVAPRTPVNIVLYRTTANGTIFYRVNPVQTPTYNDTTVDTVTIVDNVPDLALIGNELLYTTGGVLENICAPATNLLTTYNNRVMLVSAEDLNTIWYSQQVVPGSPVQFNDSLTNFIDPREGFITSIFTLDDKFIVFKTNSIFYFAGQGPNSTGNNNDFSTPFLITTDAGCQNQNSIATMPIGLMFQSSKGIYLLDRGLSTSYIGAEVEPFNTQTITSSILIPNTNQVRFTLESGTTLMYDYYYKQWSTFTNQHASDAVIFQDLFTYFNPNGTVYQETPGQFTDNGQFIPLKVTTSWLQLAGLQGYQRCYKIYILGTYKSPHNLVVSVAYDFNPGVTQQVSANATALFGGGNIYGQGNVYGNNGLYGGPAPTEQWRLDLIQQKCQAIQLTIQDSQSAPYGEGLSLSGITVIAGVKQGLNKVGPSQIIS
jgi:hypothetical protein